MEGVEKRATTLINEALSRTCLFHLLDIGMVKGELKKADITSADLPELRRIHPELKFLVSGTLTGDDLATDITLQFIHAEDGRIAHTLKAFNITTPHIEPIARKLFFQIKEAFPVYGEVIAIKESKVYVNLGQLHGLKVGDKLSVIEIIKEGDIIIDEELMGELILNSTLAI
jgi:hypothetical protein